MTSSVSCQVVTSLIIDSRSSVEDFDTKCDVRDDVSESTNFEEVKECCDWAIPKGTKWSKSEIPRAFNSVYDDTIGKLQKKAKVCISLRHQ